MPALTSSSPSDAPTASPAAAVPTPGDMPKWRDVSGYKARPATFKASLSVIGKAGNLGRASIVRWGCRDVPGGVKESLQYELFSSSWTSPAASEKYHAIGEKYGWTLTRDNHAEVAAACAALLADPVAAGVVVRDDTTTMAARDAQVAEAQARQQAEAEAAAQRKAAADAQARAWLALAETDDYWRAVAASVGLPAAAGLPLAPGTTDARDLPLDQGPDSALQRCPRAGLDFRDDGEPAVTAADVIAGPADPAAVVMSAAPVPPTWPVWAGLGPRGGSHSSPGMATLRSLLPFGILDQYEPDLPTKEIAERLRTVWVPRLIRAGIIVPVKISVRTEHNNIHISIKAGPCALHVKNRPADAAIYNRSMIGHPLLSSALYALERVAELWRWDRSDAMSDYFSTRYYVSTDISRDYAPDPALIAQAERRQGTHGPAALGDAGPCTVSAAALTGCRIERHAHTKHGRDMLLVVPSARLGDADYKAALGACKAAGGWYSRAWGKTPGGFAWWADDGDAKALDFARGQGWAE